MLALVSLISVLAAADAGPANNAGKCCADGCRLFCTDGNKCPKPSGEITTCLAECATDSDCSGAGSPCSSLISCSCPEGGPCSYPVDTNDDGCLDTCAPCPVPVCLPECTITTDANGCQVCDCPCAIVDCSPGFKNVGQDANGCGGTCEACPVPSCLPECTVTTGSDGCQVCDCPPPEPEPEPCNTKSCNCDKWCCPEDHSCVDRLQNGNFLCLGPADQPANVVRC